ncbi:MAG: hypothetical protein FWF20_00535 [Betaproteobacteria bacterium]|nr:hypothetical protein [Betaproteobacteria bacterium]MCL2885266.1 hypothetical protein [Betaproteobacteria bacterium]
MNRINFMVLLVARLATPSQRARECNKYLNDSWSYPAAKAVPSGCSITLDMFAEAVTFKEGVCFEL